jgi:hypothetical protein
MSRERRDPTGPHAFVPIASRAATPDPDGLLGKVIGSQAQLETGQRETAAQLTAIKKTLGELAEERTRGRTLLAVGRWLLTIVVANLIAGAAWLYSEHRSHDVRLTRNETRLEAAGGQLERQERIVEQTRQDVAGTRGDVRAISSTLDEVRETLRSVDTQLRSRGRR